MTLNAFLSAFKIGFWHLLSLKSATHLLFIFVILLAVDLKNWKNLIGLLSSFVLGVFIVLLLTNYNIIHIKPQMEFLILMISIAIISFLKIINVNISKGAVYTLLIGILGCLHGLKFHHHYIAVFSKKNILLPTLFYSLGIEIASIIFVAVATLAILLITYLSRVSKNNTESVLNTFSLLITVYFIAKYFI